MSDSARRNRWILAGITVLFFAPLLLAVLMQSRWWDFRPGETVNRGRLLDPPVASGIDAPAAPPWLLAYVLPSPCGAACLGRVRDLHNVHRASGRHQDRVGVAVLAEAEAAADTRAQLLAIEPGILVARVDGSALAEAGGAAGAAFLIDPGRNLILAYAPGFDSNDLHRDLQRLLHWSAQD